jgi:dimeric dUTPase (all-alpha-NTP-PPase superfamily)
MADRLDVMLDMQRALQLRFNKGKSIEEFTDAERMQAFTENFAACVIELGEAMAETGWKPWASSNHVHYNRFCKEMVDAWHFFMNMMLHGGITAEDLYASYIQKNGVNHQRITNGYDGVSSKCPACHRAYDDPNMKCSPGDNASDPPDRVPAWCEVYGNITSSGVQLDAGRGPS